jgi:GAF domain-containing protein
VACDKARRMVDEGVSLREILTHLAATAEALAPTPTAASILVLDRHGLLRNGASPNIPADYLSAIDRLRPDTNLGTCAAAAATGEPVVTRSFYDDRRWAELKHWPLSYGYRSAWSMPIKTVDSKVLGTFGSYFREERVPTAIEQETVKHLAAAAAFAIAAL